MKKTQIIIAVTSSLLLVISMITSYNAGLFIAMAGLFVALLLNKFDYGSIERFLIIRVGAMMEK